MRLHVTRNTFPAHPHDARLRPARAPGPPTRACDVEAQTRTDHSCSSRLIRNPHANNILRPTGSADKPPLHQRWVLVKYPVLNCQRSVSLLGTFDKCQWICGEKPCRFDPLRRYGRN